MCTVCLSCPKASLTLQHDCFVPCKWLSRGRINLPPLVFAFQPLSYVLSSFFALAWHVLVLEFALLALKHHLLPFLCNGNKIAKVKPTRQKSAGSFWLMQGEDKPFSFLRLSQFLQFHPFLLLTSLLLFSFHYFFLCSNEMMEINTVV